MELGTVEVFLLIAVFAPLFTGVALVDLLDRVGAPLAVASVAASWALAVVCLPLVGPALYFTIGREQIEADQGAPRATIITGTHAVITGTHPVVI